MNVKKKLYNNWIYLAIFLANIGNMQNLEKIVNLDKQFLKNVANLRSARKT